MSSRSQVIAFHSLPFLMLVLVEVVVILGLKFSYFIESQNGDVRRDLWNHLLQPPSQADLPRSSCWGAIPGDFWVCLSVVTPQPPSNLCQCTVNLTGKNLFHMFQQNFLHLFVPIAPYAVKVLEDIKLFCPSIDHWGTLLVTGFKLNLVPLITTL